MSTFSPELLEETVIDTDLATTIEPVPEGEHIALIENFKIRSVTTQDRGDVPVMDVFWDIPDDALRTKLSRDKVIVKQSIWLEMTEGKGGKPPTLASGPNQNAPLGRLLATLGLNKKGVALASLRGAGPARILVTHSRDRQNPENIYAQVVKVAPAD